MNKRVIFMGTPEFAVPSLSALAVEFEVPLVLTRPDAIRGRGKKLLPSPIKAQANALGIPVLETRRISEEVVNEIKQIHADIIAVCAYGAILPDAILETRAARDGCLNVHASLLPRWRGAAPIQRAIMAGDQRLGVSIMRMAHDLDAGPWCRQASIANEGRSAKVVMPLLADLGARELVFAIRDIDAGLVVWHEQDPALVTYARKVEKAEMLLNPADTATSNLRRVCASTDAAPARARVCGRGVCIVEARQVSACDLKKWTDGLSASDDTLAAGRVVSRHGRVFLGCSKDALEPVVVKPDGKRVMDARAWSLGLRGEPSWEVAQ